METPKNLPNRRPNKTIVAPVYEKLNRNKIRAITGGSERPIIYLTKRKFMRQAILILILLTCAAGAFAQKAGWDALQTDDGELTLNFPAGCYTSFYDPDGITVYDRASRDRFQLTEMRLVSCFRDGALLDLEIYESRDAKSAARVLAEKMNIRGGEDQLKIKKDFYTAVQSVKKDDYTLERFVIASDRKIYLITAATRRAPNETMRYFLDSMQFASGAAAAKPNQRTVLVSSLESRVPQVITNNEPDEKSPAASPSKENKPLDKLVLLSLPVPSYTDAARKGNTKGRIALRLTFGTEGRITRLQVVKDLPNGLVREAVIAAMRTKFLPAESEGVPLAVTKQIEYNFGIY